MDYFYDTSFEMSPLHDENIKFQKIIIFQWLALSSVKTQKEKPIMLGPLDYTTVIQKIKIYDKSNQFWLQRNHWKKAAP
jgi:hypothetical protein